MDLPLHENDLAEAACSKRTCSIVTVPKYRRSRCCVFQRTARSARRRGVLETKYVLRSEIGRNPVYEFLTDEGPFGDSPGVGAPLAAGLSKRSRHSG